LWKKTKYKHTKYQCASPECFQSDHLLLQCTLRAGYRQVSITTYADLNTLQRVGTCYDWVSESGYVQSVLCCSSCFSVTFETMLALFSNEEYADMVFVYGFCDGNAATAAAEYQRRYPNRRTMQNTYQSLRQTGSLPRPTYERQRFQLRTQGEILNAVERSPRARVCRISLTTGVPRMQIRRILHHDGLYPYHLQRVQHLLPNYYEQRLQFCNWLQTNWQSLDNILFTDIALFTRDGINNTRNSHAWPNENPHAMVECNFQQRFSVDVWRGVIHKYLIGPHFIEGRLTSVQYRNFLQHEFPLLLEDVPLASRVRMWIQHDGAPPHYGREVTTYLNHKFRGRWIGRGGPVTWPPRSPDLYPLDFFVWVVFKSIVYRRGKPENREQLVARTQNAFEGFTNDFPRFPWQDSMYRRLAACIEAGGGHFENILD
jgi:hypothetical protein